MDTLFGETSMHALPNIKAVANGVTRKRLSQWRNPRRSQSRKAALTHEGADGKTGVINVVGFKMNVPDTALGVNRGDIIAIINAEPGEFARRKQVKCIPGTSILRLQDNENLPDWKP